MVGDMGDRDGRQGWETWIGDRDKRLRNVVFDILTRTTTNWDINRTTKKANVHKNMFFSVMARLTQQPLTSLQVPHTHLQVKSNNKIL